MLGEAVRIGRPVPDRFRVQITASLMARKSEIHNGVFGAESLLPGTVPRGVRPHPGRHHCATLRVRSVCRTRSLAVTHSRTDRFAPISRTALMAFGRVRLQFRRSYCRCKFNDRGERWLLLAKLVLCNSLLTGITRSRNCGTTSSAPGAQRMTRKIVVDLTRPASFSSACSAHNARHVN